MHSQSILRRISSTMGSASAITRFSARHWSFLPMSSILGVNTSTLTVVLPSGVGWKERTWAWQWYINTSIFLTLSFLTYTERQIKVCTWLREISSCSCLTALPGPAWVLLSKTYKPLFTPLYVHYKQSSNSRCSVTSEFLRMLTPFRDRAVANLVWGT